MSNLKKKVILGVTTSDAHVVANKLLALMLEQKGFEVINLGACTPVEEFSKASKDNPDTLAILIGSLNGHAYEDLKPLKEAKETRAITCPVFLGGNLSVGSQKKSGDLSRFLSIGIDKVLSSFEEIIPTLEGLAFAKARKAVCQKAV